MWLLLWRQNDVHIWHQKKKEGKEGWKFYISYLYKILRILVKTLSQPDKKT